MGYEISVTPLQLAAAYATFANGGELVEPALVKEIISPDGTVRYKHKRRVVRRVMSIASADKLRHMLLDVVDEGTALQAQLDNYLLAGKTGTPRGTVRGHYVRGRYNPNFVGIFPADAPQYVIVVKLTAPQSAIYAAETAAPVTKVILQAAVAARDAALDRGKLASSVMPSRKPVAAETVEQAGAPEARLASAPTSAPTSTDSSPAEPPRATSFAPFVVTLPLRPQPAPPKTVHPIPDVRGLDLRDAVRSLHKAGFRVQLANGAGGRGGNGASSTTTPAAGELAANGTLVRLLFDY
jgi:cell division protein FtsI (penicillin-binding protein 3)